jgi:transcriptional regulator with XRE-family HTH domain
MDYEERKLWEQLFKKVVIEHIREARISKGWTQVQLAEAIDVSHEFIRSLESVKGKNTFSAFTIWRISKVLDVSLDVLLNFNMDEYRPFIEKAMQD